MKLMRVGQLKSAGSQFLQATYPQRCCQLQRALTLKMNLFTLARKKTRALPPGASSAWLVITPEPCARSSAPPLREKFANDSFSTRNLLAESPLFSVQADSPPAGAEGLRREVARAGVEDLRLEVAHTTSAILDQLQLLKEMFSHWNPVRKKL
ncbi:hypothetical protein N9L19_00745 [bacterium]|nr:hypothetical protein [bacterium]